MYELKKQRNQKSVEKPLKKMSDVTSKIINNHSISTNNSTSTKIKNSDKKSLTPLQNNPHITSNSSNFNKDKKAGSSRFQELSKLIVNKVDDILQKNMNPISVSDANSIYDKDEDRISVNSEVSENRNKKNTFITDVELLKMEKENQLKYNLTDLPDIPSGDEDLLRKEHMEFKEMLNEIESCRRQVKSEFDELEYLIKYVKDTKSNIKKHISGVSNVYSKVGIKQKSFTNNVNDSDSDSGGEELFYNKEKNINKIQDKLLKITSNVIGYHQEVSKGMEKVEKRNKKYADGKVKVKIDDEKETKSKDNKKKLGKKNTIK